MRKVFLSILLITVFCTNISAQNLDSLLTVARQTKDDSLKIGLLNRVAFSYIFNNTDKAIEVIKEGKELARQKNYNYGLTELTNVHGIYMDVTGQSDSARYYFTEALNLSRDHRFKKLESRCLNNLGMFNWNSGNYNEALDYFIKSLKMYEADGDEKSTSIPLNNIGLIYQEMNLADKALEYHNKSLEIRRKYELRKDEITSLNNIGICYNTLGRYDDAISIFKKAINAAKRENQLLDYYKILDNIANSYNHKNDYENAIKSYLEALNKPDNFKADLKGSLATYSNLTAAYNYTNKPQKGIYYSNKAFEILKSNPEYEHYAVDLYLNAAESHYMTNKMSRARELSKKFLSLKDSLFSEQNAAAIADLEVKYDTEKKEKEILVQRAELAEQDLIIQKRNYQIYSLIGFTLILGLIGYLFYNQQKLKNKQLQKENELKDALALIATQNKLQEQRLRISRELHDNIGAQLTFIISSLDNLKYAFDIKDSKLKNKLKTISEFTSNTIYELRDTIWAMNKDEISFEDLKTRIANYMDKAKMVSGDIDFSFKINASVEENKVFTSLEGINIYRILQEAINNSLKYAEATNINVDIVNRDNSLVLFIKDNGKGFDIASTEKGNGLINMEKRAKSIGGAFNIESSEGQGTEVSVML